MILDLQVCADGWTLLVSCGRDQSKDQNREGGDRRQGLVGLYHAKSGKSLSFAAAAGCFRTAPGLPPQVLNYTTERSYLMHLFNLQYLHYCHISFSSRSCWCGGTRTRWTW